MKILTSHEVLEKIEELHNVYGITRHEIVCLMELEEINKLSSFLSSEDIQHNILIVRDSDNLFLVKLLYTL